MWVAESDDVPGLAIEADNLDMLLAKLRVTISELLEANRPSKSGEKTVDAPIQVLIAQDRIRLHA